MMPQIADKRTPNRWRWVVDATYIMAATASFGLAFYSVLLDRAASAGIAASFCVAFLFLRHLPVIESFKAFNMEAKFARRVDEFDRLLGYVRGTAELSSKMLYSQLAWIDRMGSMGWSKKREFMSEMDSHLVELGVSPEFLAVAKRPILNIATYDLFAILRDSARFFLGKRRKGIAQQMQTIQERGPIAADDAEWNNLHRQQLALAMPETDVGDLSEATPLADLGAFSERFLARWSWSEQEQSVLAIIRDEVVDLASGCWQQGTVTKAAEDYIAAYRHPDDKRVKELLEPT
jgi:hypothetical protein